MSAEVLLIGATGMLGRAMAAELRRRGMNFEAPGRAELNLADPQSMEAFRRANQHPYRTVINCAAWTDVDGAEKHEGEATQVNGRALGVLWHMIRADGTLVNFGTDYVFSGESFAPYPIDAPRSPLNAYGRSKAAGEQTLEDLEALPIGWLNIRTSWLYAPWGKNFVRTMHALTREKPVLKVVNDQRGRPTSAEHLARATLDLLATGERGHHHITDGGECTWFDFAREISRLGGGTARIEPCTSAEFPRPAKRPAYSVLDLSETERLIGPMPDWRANLAGVMGRLSDGVGPGE
jgi:dTDP-4-dehydrorhamnose reductase